LPPVITASGAYYVAYGLLVVAGLISLPIMTRLLSKAEYGLLGLIYSTVSVLAVIGGMGFGEAAVRLYGEHRRRGLEDLRDFCNTLLGGSLTAGGLIAVILATTAALARGESTDSYIACLPLASLLVLIRSASGIVGQIYRAQERAVAHAATQISMRCGTMIVGISFLLLFRRAAYTVIIAAVLVEAAVLAVRLFDLRRRGIISMPRLAPQVLATAASYGLPLALASSAHFLLSYADRFMIERMLDLDAVGTYSVPYDIAAKLGEVLSTPVQLAAVPIIFRMWIVEGRDAASRFSSDVLTYVMAILLPIATLYLVYNEALIVVLASEKYADAAWLTPFLLPGIVMGSINFIVTAGLTVQKRTMVLAALVCGAALLNVGLNLILIPRWGLAGAAVATTIAYAALLASNILAAGAALELRLRWEILVKAVAATAASVSLLRALDLISVVSPPQLVLGLSLGTAAALCVFVALDQRLRSLVALQLGGERR
jgi:O-antigen/teichoic acid export membrane protein